MQACGIELKQVGDNIRFVQLFERISFTEAVVYLYGRNISDKHGVFHLYLADSSEGLLNRQAAGRSETIILTESIIEGLSLYNHGFKNVIPVYGVNGLTKDHLSLFSGNTQEIFLAFDNDQAGLDGMAKASQQLSEFYRLCFFAIFRPTIWTLDMKIKTRRFLSLMT